MRQRRRRPPRASSAARPGGASVEGGRSIGVRDAAGASLGAVMPGAGWLALALAVFASLALGIDRMPVTDRDEARFAQASKQMAVSGDWIDIRLQGEARHKKPAGIYWLQAGATHALGVPGSDRIAHYRLVSVLAATLAVPALAWAGAPLVGAGPATLAGLMLATTVLVQAEARIAKTDATLLLTVVLAMGVLARAAMGRVRGRALPALFWTALAAGVLVKGPLILAPVSGTVAWVGARRGDLGWLRALRPLPGLAWLAALVAPWYVAVTVVSGGEFWAASLGRDLAAKIAGAQESHGAPPGTYLLAALVTAWPWTMLLPLAAAVGWRTRRAPETAVLLGWLVPFWLVLEFVPTKLPHYVLPTYPALMLLVALGLARLGPPRGALFWGCAALWAAGALVVAGVVVAMPIALGDGPSAAALLGAGAGLALGLLGLWRLRGGGRAGLAALGASGLVTMWTLVSVSIPASRDVLISPRLAALSACHDGPLILGGYGEPSAPFLMGTDVVLATPAEARRVLARTPGAVAWIDVDGPRPPDDPPEVWVEGTNYSNGDPVALRLHLHPGTPAERGLCGPYMGPA